MNLTVTKANGTKEPYSEEKIRASARRVGVPDTLIDEMLAEIRSKLYEDIKTSEILAIIKSYLKHSSSPYLSSKYNLKSALAELGPSGYPFEQYVAELLRGEGYHAETNQILPGRAVTHEVDVLARKDGITYFVEVKFHKSPNQRTDIRVPLYIRARYEDIAEVSKEKTAPWIITNTRFSSDALIYANSRGIRLTSWGYPKGEGIMDLIERTQLHPITILETLSKQDKLLLLSSHIVTCRQLVDSKQAESLLSHSRYQEVKKEALAVCENSRA